MERKPADGFTGIWFVVHFIVVSNPIHDGAGSQHGIGSLLPVVSGLELK